MNIYEISHVVNPDYRGYKEEHLCYIKAKSKKAAYKKAGIEPCGFYPIKKLKKKDGDSIKKEVKEKAKEQKMLSEIGKHFSSKKKQKLLEKIKAKFKAKYKLIC